MSNFEEIWIDCPSCKGARGMEAQDKMCIWCENEELQARVKELEGENWFKTALKYQRKIKDLEGRVEELSVVKESLTTVCSSCEAYGNSIISACETTFAEAEPKCFNAEDLANEVLRLREKRDQLKGSMKRLMDEIGSANQTLSTVFLMEKCRGELDEN